VPGGAGKADWKTLEPGQVIEAMVCGMNTGGLELKVAGQRAFMPISQIELSRVEDLTPYLNKKLRCKVTELNRKRKRIVLSRRDILEEEEKANRQKLVETLQIGEMREGKVTRIAAFGAFVELLPGVDGLVHVSDMAWSRVNDPSEVVQVGTTVRVKVMKVSESGERISLSIKEAGPDPWDEVAGKYVEGADVTGTVTRTTDFGAFVELSPGVEGLVHISQLSDQRVNRVEQAVKPGQEVTARITQVDPGKRRIGLSIRALTASENQPREKTSADDLRRYVKGEKAAHAGESLGALLNKFGGDGGLKGGIG
jgi:ribosomal protein S1